MAKRKKSNIDMPKLKENLKVLESGE